MKKMSQKSKVRSKKLHFYIVTFLTFNFVFLSVAFGSGGGEEGAQVPIWKDYMWKIINFGILIFILIKFAKKPFQSLLKQRTEMIEKTLKEARDAKELAQKALQEVEGRFKTKDKEIEEILSASKRAGEVERERILEESNRLKERIFEQVKVNMEYELKHAKEAIKAEAVELAMELAEKKIKEKLTKDEQERLFEESLTKIGGKG